MITAPAPRRVVWPWLLALVGATALVYFPVARFAATNYDDSEYVFKNARVLRGLDWSGVRWAFTTAHAANWHPLTWLSHQTDVELFGTNAGGHHLVNLLLHAANVALVFLLFQRLTGATGRSAVIAALFGLHPLHVESVAWIAERKDVLSGFFAWLTLLGYVAYARAKGNAAGAEATTAAVVQKRAARWYALALGGFALGLMSKPMLVTLPLILLLLDFWPLERCAVHELGARLRPLVWEKMPFLLLSAISSLVTLVAQHQGGAVRSLESWTLGDRLANAPTATALYLGKTIWPAKLAPFYPLPDGIAWWSVAAATILVIGLSVWTLRSAARAPWRIVGWWWFLIMLVPVIGIVQVGMQQLADRYTYLPLTGIFLWVSWEAKAVADRIPALRNVFAVAAGLILAACGVTTRKQVMHWRDSGTLFTHTLAVTRKNYLAHNNLGYHFFTQGKTAEAIAEYEAALRELPDYSYAHSNLGRALAEQGRYAEAAEHFQAVLRKVPEDVITRNNLGNVLAIIGRHEEAIEQFRLVLAVKRDYVAAHNNWALSAEALNRPAEAIVHYQEAIRLSPGFHAALNNLAWLLATHPDDRLRNGAEALDLAQRACRATDCAQPGPLLTLAAASAEAGQMEAAIALATRALETARATGNATATGQAEQLLAAFQGGRPFRSGPAR